MNKKPENVEKNDQTAENVSTLATFVITILLQEWPHRGL